MERARYGDMDAGGQDIGEIVEGERALMRDRAAIVGPDPREQVLVDLTDRGYPESVDARQEALEPARPGVIAQQRVVDAVREGIASVEYPPRLRANASKQRRSERFDGLAMAATIPPISS